MSNLTAYAKKIMGKLKSNGNTPLLQDVEFGLTVNKIRQLENTGYFKWNSSYNGIMLTDEGLLYNGNDTTKTPLIIMKGRLNELINAPMANWDEQKRRRFMKMTAPFIN